MTTNTTQAQDSTVNFVGQRYAANGLALVRMTIGTMFVWVFFENLGKVATPRRATQGDQLLHQVEPLTGGLEVGSGFMSSHAAMIAPGKRRWNCPWDTVGHRTAHASGRLVAFLFLGSLGSRNWARHGFGTTGSGARIARTRGGTRRSCLGHRRVAGTAAPLVPVV